MPPESEAKTLRQALEFFLEEDHYIDRLEAEGLKDLIMKDGQISEAERAFLEEAIAKANFDGQALDLLKGLLERAKDQ